MVNQVWDTDIKARWYVPSTFHKRRTHADIALMHNTYAILYSIIFRAWHWYLEGSSLSLQRIRLMRWKLRNLCCLDFPEKYGKAKIFPLRCRMGVIVRV